MCRDDEVRGSVDLEPAGSVAASCPMRGYVTAQRPAREILRPHDRPSSAALDTGLPWGSSTRPTTNIRPGRRTLGSIVWPGRNLRPRSVGLTFGLVLARPGVSEIPRAGGHGGEEK